MAKARSKKIVATTFRGDDKAMRAFADKLRDQWPAIASAYCGQMRLAALAESAIDTGDELAFRSFVRNCGLRDVDVRAEARKSTEWRAEIFQITTTCIDWTLREARAPTLDDVVEAMRRIARAADELKKALIAAQGGERGALIRSDLERRLMWRGDISMPEMARHAGDFARAARLASNSSADDFAFIEGQAIETWIAKLMKFAKDNGLPTKISFKSDFIRFVENLRALAPNELGHHKDPGALSQEITRAIKKVKKRADAQVEADAKAEAERLAEEAEYIADYEREMAAEESRRESNQRPRWR